MNFPEISIGEFEMAQSRGPLPPTFAFKSTARTPDGSLVAEGKPYGNGALSRLWRLPTLLIPRTLDVSATAATAVNLATWAAVAALAVWTFKRVRR